MDDIVTAAPARTRGRSIGLVGAGLVAGLVLAGLTAASAQGPGSAPAAPSASPSAPSRDKHPFGPHGRRGPGGPGGPGGLGGVLHGEGTTRAPGGGYQVLAVQLGEVTAVSPASITVQSEDGYSRTYAVDDDTLVNAGDTGIGDVETGHRVHVVAVVADGTARAVRVADLTTLKDLRGKWRPERRGVRPTPSAAA